RTIKQTAGLQARPFGTSLAPSCISVDQGSKDPEPSPILTYHARGTFGVDDMRLAFVLRLGNQCRPAAGAFEGWVQEVDSCTELRFRSTEQLLKFLGQRFDLDVLTKKSEQELGSEP